MPCSRGVYPWGGRLAALRLFAPRPGPATSTHSYRTGRFCSRLRRPQKLFIGAAGVDTRTKRRSGPRDRGVRRVHSVVRQPSGVDTYWEFPGLFSESPSRKPCTFSFGMIRGYFMQAEILGPPVHGMPPTSAISILPRSSPRISVCQEPRWYCTICNRLARSRCPSGRNGFPAGGRSLARCFRSPRTGFHLMIRSRLKSALCK